MENNSIENMFCMTLGSDNVRLHEPMKKHTTFRMEDRQIIIFVLTAQRNCRKFFRYAEKISWNSLFWETEATFW